MPRLPISFASAGLTLVSILSVAPASAQIAHTYVSRTGGGSACTFAAPCNSINTAIAATSSGGDLSILNGDYAENVVIDRDIAIHGESTENIVIRATTTNNTSTTVTINAPNSANVNLHNLNIYADLNGVMFNSGRRLTLSGGTSISGAGNLGLNFIPSSAASSGPTILQLSNASVHSNSNGNVLIKPSAGVAVSAFLDDARTEGNLFGVRADNTGGSGAITVQMQMGWANNSRTGIVAVGTGPALVSMVVQHYTAENNTFGIVSAGAQAEMIVTGSTIDFNSIGMDQEAGAVLADFGNNVVNFNTSANISGTVSTIAKK